MDIVSLSTGDVNSCKECYLCERPQLKCVYLLHGKVF